MNLEETKAFAYEEVRLLPAHVRFNDYDFPAGKAILHLQSGKVLQTVSNGYNLIQNKEFIQFLNGFYSLKVEDIHINHTGDTFAFSGYFLNEDEFVWMDSEGRKVRVGFEMYNSYNNKSQPLATYSYFINDPKQLKPYFIRTSIPIFRFTRKQWAEKKDRISLENFTPMKATLLGRDNEMPYSMYRRALSRYRSKLPSVMRPTFDRVMREHPDLKFYSFLRIIGLTTQIWERTSYETATKAQKDAYIRRIE